MRTGAAANAVSELGVSFQAFGFGPFGFRLRVYVFIYRRGSISGFQAEVSGFGARFGVSKPVYGFKVKRLPTGLSSTVGFADRHIRFRGSDQEWLVPRHLIVRHFDPTLRNSYRSPQCVGFRV